MPTIRNTTSATSGGSTTAAITLPVCQPGDRLIVIAGGGNHVTGFPSGWQQLDYQLGQEAQGWVMTKIAEASDSGAGITLSFDGGDTRRIVAVATVGEALFTVLLADRFGTAGSTFPASSTSLITLDAVPGDVLVAYAFARNGSVIPSSTALGTPAYSLATNPSWAAWVDPVTVEGAVGFTIDLPSRSGHYVYSLVLWSPYDLDTQNENLFGMSVKSSGSGYTGSLDSLWDGDPTTGITIAPNGGFVLNLLGNFVGLDVDSIRIEADSTGGSWNWTLDVGSPSPAPGYYAFGSTASAESLPAQADYFRRLDQPYFASSGHNFSVADMINSIANYPAANYGASLDLGVPFSSAPVTMTRLDVIAYKQVRVMPPVPDATGEIDTVRRRFF